MSNFRLFKTAVNDRLSSMANTQLFRVNIDKDLLWETYLGSFPAGTNPIFRERTEHDCQCCKQFIRAAGNIVAIVENELVSVWDIEAEEPYQTVANALAGLVKDCKVDNICLHYEKNLGTDYNHQLLEDGQTIKWEHFHYKLPSKFVIGKAHIGTKLSDSMSSKDVFMRGLEEITVEAAETVLELIEQNSIYRGTEHKRVVDLFVKHKKEYDELPENHKNNYCWVKSVELGSPARIRNTVIGTLLVDISNEVDLDHAVRSFETKVAPTNYKRPTAVISKRMIADAQNKVQELGFEDALHRRYAVAEDLTINNVLFADRSARKAMSVFEEMAEEVPENVSKLNKVDEVDMETFINSIVPKAESIELLAENRHVNNLMSLIAPVHPDAKHIFKWDNNFSWAYNGEVTDSIKERVKQAGGTVEGILRCSLSWFNYDDLDIHVREPDRTHIYYGDKRSYSSGILDVDMNAGGPRSREAVENIIWTNKARMKHGVYEVWVNNYCQREMSDVGFDVEIEHGGTIHSFHYDKKVGNGKNVMVAKFKYDGDKIEFIESLPSTKASKEVWGITTETYQKVSMILNSPNHWDDKAIGNKHLFFILEGCRNDVPARGFFNEFLKESLSPHRKVFEVLGSKMKTDTSDRQLSGIGFSSTQKNHVFCKVTGNFARTIKINLIGETSCLKKQAG